MTSSTDIQRHFGRVQVDNLKLSGSPTSLGVWSSFTPAFNTGTFTTGSQSLEGRFTTIGKTAFVSLSIVRGAATGAADGSGVYTINLPPGINARQSLGDEVVGVGTISIATALFDVTVVVPSGEPGRVAFFLANAGADRVRWSSTAQPFTTTGAIQFRANLQLEIV